MTIYATPFRDSDKQCIGPSTDSGFVSIDQVVEVMGTEPVHRAPRLVIYGDGEDRVVFSDNILFYVDGFDNRD